MNQILTDELGQDVNIKDSNTPTLRGKECILANIYRPGNCKLYKYFTRSNRNGQDSYNKR